MRTHDVFHDFPHWPLLFKEFKSSTENFHKFLLQYLKGVCFLINSSERALEESRNYLSFRYNLIKKLLKWALLSVGISVQDV